MTPKIVVQSLTVFGLALGAIYAAIQPSSATEATFFCGTHGNRLATIVRTSQRDVPVRFIRGYDYFSLNGYPLERRCQEVTRRFQISHENGVLEYITVVTSNGRSVLCAAKNYGGKCEMELLDLPIGSSADRVLTQGFALNNDRGIFMYHRQSDRTYIDFKKYLEIENN